MLGSAGDAAVPQSATTADYVTIIAVIAPWPFFMCVIPLIADRREEQRSRHQPTALQEGPPSSSGRQRR